MASGAFREGLIQVKYSGGWHRMTSELGLEIDFTWPVQICCPLAPTLDPCPRNTGPKGIARAESSACGFQQVSCL